MIGLAHIMIRPLSYNITGESVPIFRSVEQVKPKTWRILGFADVISMTTGPLSSCELPLTNRDPNELTEAFPLPKKLYLILPLLLYVFVCLSNKFGVQQINKYLNFLGIWMLSNTDKGKCFFSLVRIIKLCLYASFFLSLQKHFRSMG